MSRGFEQPFRFYLNPKPCNNKRAPNISSLNIRRNIHLYRGGVITIRRKRPTDRGFPEVQDSEIRNFQRLGFTISQEDGLLRMWSLIWLA